MPPGQPSSDVGAVPGERQNRGRAAPLAEGKPREAGLGLQVISSQHSQRLGEYVLLFQKEQSIKEPRYFSKRTRESTESHG